MDPDHATVAAVEKDGTIRVFGPEAEEPGNRASLTLGEGRWPAWHPREPLLAVSLLGADDGGRELRSEVRLLSLNGDPPRTMYRVPEGAPPVIAPRVPHYVHWSPDGAWLAVAGPSPEGLALMLCPVDGPEPVHEALRGAPLFSSWHPGSRLLAVHAGMDLVLVEPWQGPGYTPRALSDRAAGFRTPAFTPDGNEVIYAVAGEPGVVLIAARADGGGSRELGRFPGGVAFGFRPGTTALLVGTTRQPDSGRFERLVVVDTAHAEPKAHQFASGPFLSWAWDPAGTRLAVVGPSHLGEGRFQLRVLDPSGAAVATAEPFVPAVDYRTATTFFDQYRHSHPMWTADGSEVLVTGRVLSNVTSPSFGDARDFVMSWRPVPNSPLVILTPGDHAAARPLRDGHTPAVNGE